MFLSFVVHIKQCVRCADVNIADFVRVNTSKFGSYCMSLFICYKEVSERWINRTDVMIYSNPTISTKRMNDEKGKILFSPVSIYIEHFFVILFVFVFVYVDDVCLFQIHLHFYWCCRMFRLTFSMNLRIYTLSTPYLLMRHRRASVNRWMFELSKRSLSFCSLSLSWISISEFKFTHIQRIARKRRINKSL